MCKKKKKCSEGSLAQCPSAKGLSIFITKVTQSRQAAFPLCQRLRRKKKSWKKTRWSEVINTHERRISFVISLLLQRYRACSPVKVFHHIFFQNFAARCQTDMQSRLALLQRKNYIKRHKLRRVQLPARSLKKPSQQGWIWYRRHPQCLRLGCGNSTLTAVCCPSLGWRDRTALKCLW